MWGGLMAKKETIQWKTVEGWVNVFGQYQKVDGEVLWRRWMWSSLMWNLPLFIFLFLASCQELILLGTEPSSHLSLFNHHANTCAVSPRTLGHKNDLYFTFQLENIIFNYFGWKNRLILEWVLNNILHEWGKYICWEVGYTSLGNVKVWRISS